MKDPTTAQSHIAHFPDETLIQIFGYFLEIQSRNVHWKTEQPATRPESFISSIPNRKSSPLTLTHVCQTWRELVRSTSKLWSSIAIHNPRLHQLGFISLWLDLARSQPLSICVLHGRDENSKAFSAIDNIMPLLGSRRHLWRSIYFELLDFKPTFDIPLGALPMLEHANMDMVPDTYKNNVWSIIHSSPQLSSVVWSLYFDALKTAPWDKLKYIECRFAIDLCDLLRSLRSCRNLEALYLTRGFNASGMSKPIALRPFTLPSLRTLSLQGLGMSESVQLPVARNKTWGLFLQSVNAPQLTSLRWELWNTTEDRSTFHNFIKSSRCNLKTLHLQPVRPISKAALLRWLDTPGLKAVTDLQVRPKNIASTSDDEIGYLMKHINPHPGQTYMDAAIAKIKEGSGVIHKNSATRSQ